MNTYPYRTYAEIDLNKLQHNLRQVRKFVGDDCRIMFVVKADAYGHGIPMCAKYSEPFVDYYAVATMDEALLIRNAGVKKPILIFGAIQDSEILCAAENGITLNVFSPEYAQHVHDVLKTANKTIRCHIEINTGMNRTGLYARKDCVDRAVQEYIQIQKLTQLDVTGTFTHFSCGDSDKPEDIAYTSQQYDTFQSVLKLLKQKNISAGITHCASTGPLLCHPERKLDMVRVGMLGYGQSISEAKGKEMGLLPVMRWCAKITSILDLNAGESVSYGRTYHTAGPERIAVFSAGYADGYNRSYSNRSNVIIHDTLVPECGRICMDFGMANVTNIGDVKVGDEVILLGSSERCTVSADALSALIEGGVNGWTTCQISHRVPRIYIYNGAVVHTRMLLQ